MDNNLTQPKTIVQGVSAVILVILLAIGGLFLGGYLQKFFDPYVQEVLKLQGDNHRGYDIFQINCAACHGSKGDGYVGPSLVQSKQKRSKVSLIHQVTSGQTPPMPKFQPNPQDMADLLSYLEKL